ncbi:MAG: hypothetical protein JWM26_3020 [Betaproteobacteria bacterium]|nr:hypothetical protein [Betaproteobacteria bacterium]
MAVNERDTAGEDSRIAALYREAALEEPPPYLDASIRRDARRALDAPAAARARPWWSAWRVPVAFAAVAVLSVSVVAIVSREGGEPLTIGERVATSEAPSAAAPQAAPGADHAPAETEAQAPERTRRKLEARQRQDRRGDASAPATQSAVPPGEASAPSSQSAAPRGEPIAPPRASAADASAQAAAGASPTLADQERSAPAPAAEAAAAATAPAAVQRRRAETSAAPAARPAMAARNALTPAVAAMVVELDGRAPAAWLERVATLRRDGRTDDADALLAEFRRRYPDEPLPEAFR